MASHNSGTETPFPPKVEQPAGRSDVETPAPVKDAPPEGGYVGWSSVVGAWLVLFVTFGYVNAFGVYEDFYTRVYLTNKTAGTISWIGSVQFFLQFAIGLISGQALDRGFFRHTAILGSLVYCFSLFMLSLAKHEQYYQVFLSQGIGMGIGMGFLFLPAVGVVGHHFRRRRAYAMGIVVSGSSVGGVVFPIMLNHLINGSVGFANGVRASAYLITGLLVLANILMKPGHTRPPVGEKRERPDVAGFFREPQYILAMFGCCFVLLGLLYPLFYLQLFAVEHGISKSLSFYSISILNAASIFGRILPNFYADLFGMFNLALPVGAACGALVFAMLGLKDPGSLIVFALLYGFFSGAFVSLMGPLMASMAKNVKELGVRMGIAFFVSGIAGLVGSPLNGALLGVRYRWWRSSTFSGIVIFAGVAMLLGARQFMVRVKGSQHV